MSDDLLVDDASAEPATAWASIASLEQERVWTDELAGVADQTYNLLASYRLRGSLQVRNLVSAVRELVLAHEVLRTTFRVENGQLEQVVRSEAVGPVVIDLSDLDPAIAERTATAMLERERAHVFNLAGRELVRTGVIRLSAEEHIFVFDVHHILVDQWSVSLLLEELSRRYLGNAAIATPQGPTYADYAQWQRQTAGSSEQSAAFWREQLRDAEPFQLRERPAWAQAARVTAAHTEPTGVDVATLTATARALDVTSHLVGLAAVGISLARLGNTADPIVVLPVANRSNPLTHDIVGLFVNLLPVPVPVTRAVTLAGAVAAAATASAAALEHESLPFQEIVRHSGRTASELLTATYYHLVGERGQLRIDGCEVTPLDVQQDVAQFDLTIGLEVNEAEAVIKCQYNAARFDASVIADLCAQAAGFVRAVAADPGQSLTAVLSELSPPMQSTATTVRPSRDPLQLFHDRVRTDPTAVAITEGSTEITYAELSRRAGAIAAELQQLAPRPGDPIGLLMERSVAAVASILAVTALGLAYVPLDPADPPGRRELIARTAGIEIVLSDGALTVPAGCRELDATGTGTEGPALPVSEWPGDLPIAVMHTSGSTGAPKGVEVTRGGIANLIDQKFVELGPDRRVAFAAPLAFDASSFELWGALATGATLVVIPTEQLTGAEALGRLLGDAKVTTMFVTSALFNHLVRTDPTVFSGLHELITGGERADADCFRAVIAAADGPRLLHAYGPTETTTFATIQEIRSLPDAVDEVPIGYPLDGLEVQVLDRWLLPLPPGHRGEIFIGGAGVTAGYRGAPRATAEKFVPDPASSSPGRRMYRTGDFAVREAGLDLYFAGRGDRQLKIRGHRVELTEVEQHTAAVSGAAQAVVVPVGPAGDLQLVAFLAGGAPRDPGEVQQALSAALPPYAVPARIEIAPELPLTASGKIDRRRLVTESLSRTGAGRPSFDDPVTRTLAEAWHDAVGDWPALGRNGFFEAGGHSLSAVRLLDRIQSDLGVVISVREFLADSSFEHLCDAARTAGQALPDDLDLLIDAVEKEG